MAANGVTQQFTLALRIDNFRHISGLIRLFVVPAMHYKIEVVERNMAEIDALNMAQDGK
jgi:hypothetical protein